MIQEIVNPLQPANRLPPELLAEVLQYRGDDKELIAATHVCSYWRSCLLSTPPLWTNFRFKSFDRTRTYLARCKSAPVSIRVPIARDRGSLFEYIFHHAAEIRDLCLDGPPSVVPQCVDDINKPLPSLRSLELRVRSEITPTDAYTLPSTFLGSQAPSLRSLVLRGVHPPTCIPLPNLSILTLHFYAETTPIRLKSIFASLSQAPNLQELRVSVEECELSVDSQTVTLDRLERFELIDSRPIHILSRVKLPSLRSLLLVVPLAMDVPNFTLANFLPPSECLSLKDVDQMSYEVKIAGRSKRLVTFSTQHLKVTLFVYPESDTADNHAHASIGFRSWLSDTSPVSLAQIKRAEISGVVDPGEIPFTALENLEILHSRGSSRGGTITALSSRHFDGLFLCPRLRTLDIQWERDVDIGELVRLVDLARNRMEEGHSFDNVRVAGSVVGRSSHFESLREYVGELDLSGVIEKTEES